MAKRAELRTANIALSARLIFCNALLVGVLATPYLQKVKAKGRRAFHLK